MEKRKWRNPYPAVRKSASSRPPVPKGDVAPAPSFPLPIQKPKDLKKMAYKMREDIRNLSLTVHQIEEMLESFCGFCDMMEHVQRKKGSLNSASLVKTLKRIDFKQLVELLQSPLVQALLTESLRDSREQPDVMTK
ncbi:hypothetical protein BSNK01_00850 [Bacillaceae bacterium]